MAGNKINNPTRRRILNATHALGRGLVGGLGGLIGTELDGHELSIAKTRREAAKERAEKKDEEERERKSAAEDATEEHEKKASKSKKSRKSKGKKASTPKEAVEDAHDDLVEKFKELTEDQVAKAKKQFEKKVSEIKLPWYVRAMGSGMEGMVRAAALDEASRVSGGKISDKSNPNSKESRDQRELLSNVVMTNRGLTSLHDRTTKLERAVVDLDKKIKDIKPGSSSASGSIIDTIKNNPMTSIATGAGVTSVVAAAATAIGIAIPLGLGVAGLGKLTGDFGGDRVNGLDVNKALSEYDAKKAQATPIKSIAVPETASMFGAGGSVKPSGEYDPQALLHMSLLDRIKGIFHPQEYMKPKVIGINGPDDNKPTIINNNFVGPPPRHTPEMTPTERALAFHGGGSFGLGMSMGPNNVLGGPGGGGAYNSPGSSTGSRDRVTGARRDTMYGNMSSFQSGIVTPSFGGITGGKGAYSGFSGTNNIGGVNQAVSRASKFANDGEYAAGNSGEIPIGKDGRINPKDVYNYIRSKGIDHAHTVGIINNMEAESGFKPGSPIHNDVNGPSAGLFQHHNDRMNGMINHAGKDWATNPKGQIDFLLGEGVTKKYLATKFNSGTEASIHFTKTVEVPANKDAEASKRAGNIGKYDGYTFSDLAKITTLKSKKADLPSGIFGGLGEATAAQVPAGLTTKKVKTSVESGQPAIPDTSKLRVKGGPEGQAFAGGETNPGILSFAAAQQATNPNLNRFTSFNDSYHKGTGSLHARGLATDFTLNDTSKAPETAEQIRRDLKEKGINATVIDEYNHPSSRRTAGHIHVQFNSPHEAAKYQPPPSAPVQKVSHLDAIKSSENPFFAAAPMASLSPVPKAPIANPFGDINRSLDGFQPAPEKNINPHDFATINSKIDALTAKIEAVKTPTPTSPVETKSPSHVDKVDDSSLKPAKAAFKGLGYQNPSAAYSLPQNANQI